MPATAPRYSDPPVAAGCARDACHRASSLQVLLSRLDVSVMPAAAPCCSDPSFAFGCERDTCHRAPCPRLPAAVGCECDARHRTTLFGNSNAVGCLPPPLQSWDTGDARLNMHLNGVSPTLPTTAFPELSAQPCMGLAGPCSFVPHLRLAPLSFPVTAIGPMGDNLRSPFALSRI